MCNLGTELLLLFQVNTAAVNKVHYGFNPVVRNKAERRVAQNDLMVRQAYNNRTDRHLAEQCLS